MTGLRIAALSVALALLLSGTAAAGGGRVVTDRILRVPLPSGWTGPDGPGCQGTHPVAWLLAGDFHLPAGAATHEGHAPVPRSKALLVIGDFYPAGRSDHWPIVRKLRMPARLIRTGRWWQVRYVRRALAIQVVFGSHPTRHLVSQIENVLESTRPAGTRLAQGWCSRP